MKLDITMQGSATNPKVASSTAAAPWGVPGTGWWSSTVVGPPLDYLAFRARKNRSFTIEVTALDEQRRGAQQKMVPAIGVWDQTNAVTAAPDVVGFDFDSAVSGMTEVVASTSADDLLRFAVGDMRGEARADFAYRGRLFYADAVQTTRGANSLTLRITGYGFGAATTVTVGGVRASVLTVSANRIAVTVPRPSNGV